MASDLTVGLDAPRGGCGTVTASGSLTEATAHTLLDALDVELGPIGGDELVAVEVDLRRIGRCDRDGVRVILALVRRAGRRGVRTRVLPSPCVRAALLRERRRIAAQRAALA